MERTRIVTSIIVIIIIIVISSIIIVVVVIIIIIIIVVVMAIVTAVLAWLGLEPSCGRLCRVERHRRPVRLPPFFGNISMLCCLTYYFIFESEKVLFLSLHLSLTSFGLGMQTVLIVHSCLRQASINECLLS